jgi:hypothetical protein
VQRIRVLDELDVSVEWGYDDERRTALRNGPARTDAITSE